MIALTCLAFSLLSIPIGSSLDAAIAIVQGDPDGGDEDNQDGVRRAAQRGGYYAAKSPLATVSSTRGAPKYPLRPATKFGQTVSTIARRFRPGAEAACYGCSADLEQRPGD